ncbi:gluconate 2-dehydrogenase subunit 3 family protein [Pseudoalteromonas denitrificans]|uniref:Gluconate 2-dehydrogenase gamma chain n=1 Tax=Pseudoalteromonas denitrificans DSM 6059 TaxID=1123010 RepID=A0A1I1GZ77_9GAMM|nr:gluconate 2-dehydrogenase subunit 3 family protein [Pseudoalteromonas denitrificans]SFC14473.1 gluconate 2-dehydrogenase gamma chain [Pseudoalteromonas denitrificans DSM 6059]
MNLCEIQINKKPPESGLTRRDFLRSTTSIALLATLGTTKPIFSKNIILGTNFDSFTLVEETTLKAVQMILFPDDGDGPSAEDLRAYQYLDWALEDPQNISDGDRSFIKKGIAWLDELANKNFQKDFIYSSTIHKNTLLDQISHSKSGENWISLLLYYLIEALTLDPIYGGNKNGIGWRWLKHQPGFPQPGINKTYLNFI